MNWNVRRYPTRFYMIIRTSSSLSICRGVSIFGYYNSSSSACKGWHLGLNKANIFSKIKDDGSDPNYRGM